MYDIQLLDNNRLKSKEKLSNALSSMLFTLKEREAEIVRLRFGLSDGRIHTLKEIGERLHLSRERIRQIEKKALRQLNSPSKKQRLEALTGLSSISVIKLLQTLSAKNS